MSLMPRRALLLGVVFLAACATAGAGGEGGVEMALKRAGGWSTLRVRPGVINGPSVTLELRRGRLSGTYQGRSINLEVTRETLSGQVGTGAADPAGGTIEVDIAGPPENLEVSGLWCGQRVHVTITPESLRGTIRGPAAGQCQYVLDRLDHGARVGTSICRGMPEDTRLELPEALGGLLKPAQVVAVLLVLLSTPP
jgi:hypothetical protein